MISILLFFLMPFSTATTDLVTLTQSNYATVMGSGQPIFMMFYSESNCYLCPTVYTAFTQLPQIVGEANLNVVVALVDIALYYTPALDFNIDTFPNLLLHTTAEDRFCPVTTSVNTMANFLISYVPASNDSNSEVENKGFEVEGEKREANASQEWEEMKEERGAFRGYGRFVIGLAAVFIWAFLFIICSMLNRKVSERN